MTGRNVAPERMELMVQPSGRWIARYPETRRVLKTGSQLLVTGRVLQTGRNVAPERMELMVQHVQLV